MYASLGTEWHGVYDLHITQSNGAAALNDMPVIVAADPCVQQGPRLVRAAAAYVARQHQDRILVVREDESKSLFRGG